MYADGNGVAQDDLRAFEYFSRIVGAHAEDSPSAPQAAIIANAFVALGRYYLNGIPNSKVAADPARAREMFSYAASYFGNADAQYDLARLYLKAPDASRTTSPMVRAGSGVPPRRASIRRSAARPDAVQWRAAAAAGRARPDVAGPWRATARVRTRPGSRKATTRRSPRRPRKTAPGRCRCSTLDAGQGPMN